MFVTTPKFIKYLYGKSPQAWKLLFPRSVFLFVVPVRFINFEALPDKLSGEIFRIAWNPMIMQFTSIKTAVPIELHKI